MALQGNVTTFGGEIRQDQYIKIEDVTVTKDTLRVSAGYYTSKEQSDDGTPPYEVTDYDGGSYSLDGDNPLVQGYEYLKTEKHSDSTDV